jgi:L-malate glycosyltransferase
MSRFFTMTVAVSDDIRNQLKERYRFADKRVVVIHNGVHLPDKICNDSPTSAAHQFTIGSSGRLFPVKDFPLFVEIARIVVQQEPSIRFELAGEGPGRPQLESLLAAYNLQDRFHLHGHLDDMDAFYNGLDLYLNTSLHEGIPMTILEAMGRGIPVIAPAVGGIREIITPGKDGFLIDGRDPYTFAEQCLLLYRDRQLRQAMARAARETVERDFSVGKMADRYYQLYCSITNSAHREGAR